MSAHPDNDSVIPEIPINIQSEPVMSKFRKLKTTWSLETADDLRSLWGGGPTKPDNALDVFTQGLDDPEFDPGKPYHGKKAPEEKTEESLIDAMAKEMAAEIDREIMRDLGL